MDDEITLDLRSLRAAAVMPVTPVGVCGVSLTVKKRKNPQAPPQNAVDERSW